MLNSLIRFLFPLLRGIEASLERIETHMVTKEQFDAAQTAYFAKVDGLIAAVEAHPAAADFTDELNALNVAAAKLTALTPDPTTTDPTTSTASTA